MHADSPVPPPPSAKRCCGALFPLVLGALAMGLGWGIRGQFGHQPGAMVPGALIGLVLALLRGASALETLRLAAIGAVATSVGGSMTYAQTIGLVQEQSPAPHYWWGLLGLVVKGAVWIGIPGAFLGMAGGGTRYRAREILAVVGGMVFLALIGEQLLNRPHDPAAGKLPALYFSRWYDPKPRMENWGGMWLALLGLMAYARIARGDRAALHMALWGMLAGGVGFAGAEMVNAWGVHAKPFGESVQAWLDWWKVMEVGFGMAAGAGLAWGWTRLPLPSAAPDVEPAQSKIPARVETAAVVFWVAFHLCATQEWLGAKPFWDWPFVHTALLLPAAFTGRITPLLVTGGLLAYASGFNVAEYLCLEKKAVAVAAALPLLALLTAVVGRAAAAVAEGAHAAARLLVLTAWVHTALSFLKMLWPPMEGQAQIPTQIVFALMALAITRMVRWGCASAPEPVSCGRSESECP